MSASVPGKKRILSDRQRENARLRAETKKSVKVSERNTRFERGKYPDGEFDGR